MPVELRVPVTRLEPNLPYGADTRVLAVVPAIAVTLSPSQAVVPLAAPDKKIRLRAEVLNNRDGKNDGTLTLRAAGRMDGGTRGPALPVRARG